MSGLLWTVADRRTVSSVGLEVGGLVMGSGFGARVSDVPFFHERFDASVEGGGWHVCDVSELGFGCADFSKVADK